MSTTTPAQVTYLPTRKTAEPGPVDLSALSRTDLLVIFYAANLPWLGIGDDQSTQRMADVVVATINRIGLGLIQQIAAKADAALAEKDWRGYEALMPSLHYREDAWAWSGLFFKRLRALSGKPEHAELAWRLAVAA